MEIKEKDQQKEKKIGAFQWKEGAIEMERCGERTKKDRVRLKKDILLESKSTKGD